VHYHAARGMDTTFKRGVTQFWCRRRVRFKLQWASLSTTRGAMGGEDEWTETERRGVIRVLKAHLAPATVPDAEAPVRHGHRYLNQRQNQVDHPAAISRHLPIGSGENPM